MRIRLQTRKKPYVCAAISISWKRWSTPVNRSAAKLDFLVQEINRETNTIGSKVQDVELARVVVDVKAEIEKIREQIQNIE